MVMPVATVMDGKRQIIILISIRLDNARKKKTADSRIWTALFGILAKIEDKRKMNLNISK